ncbi:MAG TPA: PPOX class F420-dependent oxidoreductase [Solirubrobacteraceae bacterium]
MAASTSLDPDVRELLTARNMAHVATLMNDGAPHVSPVWIEVLDNDRLAIFSTQAHLKIRNLRRDPRIAISVADEHNPYRSVVIRGRVVQELSGEPAIEIMDRLSRRYTGADFPVRSAIVMVIQPERVRLQNLPFDHHPANPAA